MDNLLCQSNVTLGSLGLNIVKQDRPAVTRSFAQPDIARNDGRKELSSEKSPEVLHHLMGQVRALIEHCHEHALDFQIRIA